MPSITINCVSTEACQAFATRTPRIGSGTSAAEVALRRSSRCAVDGCGVCVRARQEPSAARDGNKRIGFLAMVTFLGLNGYELTATDGEVVAEIVALVEGTVSEQALADWIREHCTSGVVHEPRRASYREQNLAPPARARRTEHIAIALTCVALAPTRGNHRLHVANYTAKDITVSRDFEPVRKRPAYIGGVGTAGLHHLVWEILDNAVDEAMNGYASNIQVVLHKDGSSITVTDDGRGIPVDKHPTTKKSATKSSSMLHAGGKFEQGNYKTAGGLHGVGASVVNA